MKITDENIKKGKKKKEAMSNQRFKYHNQMKTKINNNSNKKIYIY